MPQNPETFYYLIGGVVIGIVLVLLIWKLMSNKNAKQELQKQEEKQEEKQEQKSTPQQQPLRKMVTLYFAEWCGHCKTMKPVWERVKQELHQQGIKDIGMQEVDAEKEKIPVKGYPTIISQEQGKDGYGEYKQGPDFQKLLKFVIEG